MMDTMDNLDTMDTVDMKRTLEVERTRALLLRSWTMARQHEERMTREAVEKWERDKRRRRGQEIMDAVLGLPPALEPDTGWLPFDTLLRQFEAAVRQDERARVEGR